MALLVDQLHREYSPKASRSSATPVRPAQPANPSSDKYLEDEPPIMEELILWMRKWNHQHIMYVTLKLTIFPHVVHIFCVM